MTPYSCLLQPHNQIHHPLSSEHQNQQQTQGHGGVLDEPQLAYTPPSGLETLDSSNDNCTGNILVREPMQSDSGGPVAQFTPNLDRFGDHFSHQRESSLSSLASTNGPASPFASTTPNLRVAVTDSTVDAFSDMTSQEMSATQGGSYYQLAKSLNPHTGYHNVDNGLHEMAYPAAIPGPGKKGHLDRALLPAPNFAGGHSRSLPASVASSIAGDSPATPCAGGDFAEHVDRRRTGEQRPRSNGGDDGLTQIATDCGSNVPKLDRTMTDVYGDELYNPNFAITSASPSRSRAAVSPGNDIFSQRINAANSHYLRIAHSPSSTTSRAKSPFRTESPFVVPCAQNVPFPGHQFDSTMRTKGHAVAQCDLSILLQQAGRELEPETPKTISPKDALLEFNDGDGDSSFPLFSQDPVNFGTDALVKDAIGHDVDQPYLRTEDGGNPPTSIMVSPSQMNIGVQVPQQYPFIPKRGAGFGTPPRLSSSGSSSVASGISNPTSKIRPSTTNADSGTYTCTYHGCTHRFETPSLLQKHKREGHRQTQGLIVGREMGTVSNLLNSQAGPHRCDRLNPSTGKPCSTVFSRPYDLTRHEDTIHNGRKQKVRCDLCTEEKTFSRADALTRHYRVCHPEVELPGKHRRRGGG